MTEDVVEDMYIFVSFSRVEKEFMTKSVLRVESE